MKDQEMDFEEEEKKEEYYDIEENKHHSSQQQREKRVNKEDSIVYMNVTRVLKQKKIKYILVITV